MSSKAWQPAMVKCVLRYLHDCLPQGLAAGSQHCSRRSDYKRGSSGPIVQLFQSSGISTVKKMWPDPKQAYIANTEPVFLCSASVQSQLGSVLCVSIQKHFELGSSQSWSVLFAVKAEKYFVFFCFFPPRMAALDCNRSCCVTAGKNMHDLVKGWIRSHAVHFQMKKRKSLCFLFQCFFVVCFMMIISGYINLKNGKIINNSPLDTVYHRCLLNLPINILIHLPRRRRPTSPWVVLKPAALQAPNIRRWATRD